MSSVLCTSKKKKLYSLLTPPPTPARPYHAKRHPTRHFSPNGRDLINHLHSAVTDWLHECPARGLFSVLINLFVCLFVRSFLLSLVARLHLVSHKKKSSSKHLFTVKKMMWMKNKQTSKQTFILIIESQGLLTQAAL